MRRDEAKALIAADPESYLKVTRPDAMLPAEIPYDSGAAYAGARAALAAFRAAAMLTADDRAGYFAYRIIDGELTQLGVVGLAHVEDYANNTIRRHELTRPDKEADRARHMVETGTHPEPVLLAHEPTPAIRSILERATASVPLADVHVAGARHTLWRVDDIEGIDLAFSELSRMYVADGHHRCASAVRAAAMIDEHGPVGDGHHWIPVVVFPSDTLRILSYNRILRGASLPKAEKILEALRSRGKITDPAPRALPPRGTLAIYCGDRWVQFTPALAHSATDPLGALDVSMLARELLEPILGIFDSRGDPRVDFVGGSRGLKSLEEAVSSGGATIAIALAPTSMQDLMAVTDAGLVMPTKSTWFDPKLASGLFVHAFAPPLLSESGAS